MGHGKRDFKTFNRRYILFKTMPIQRVASVGLALLCFPAWADTRTNGSAGGMGDAAEITSAAGENKVNAD